jgi:hypothetical protein
VRNTIDVAFTKQFEAEVHLEYQRMGSKLRSMVRTKSGVRGSVVQFPIMGHGEATQKARHGEIPPMNPLHTNRSVTLQDWYAGSWVDTLDEYKTNIDERGILAKLGAAALGRKTDKLITDALDTVPPEQTIGDGTTGLTKALVQDAIKKFNKAEVPDDGQRFAAIGPDAWEDLMNIPEFADADYIGDGNLPWLQGATQTRPWRGIWWMQFTGLPTDDDVTHNFLWHKDVVGHAIATEVQSDITWHGDRAAWFINNMMSQGALVIDDTGVIRIDTLGA